MTVYQHDPVRTIVLVPERNLGHAIAHKLREDPAIRVIGVSSDPDRDAFWIYEADPDVIVADFQAGGLEFLFTERLPPGDHPGVAGQLAATLSEDPFWAVRVAAVETLASLKGPESETEVRAATSDERSEVRRAAIRALGGAEDATLVPFFRERFLSDSSYLVQAESLRAIGRSGDEDQIDFLRQASRVDSPRDVIRAAAEWAIGEIAGLPG